MPENARYLEARSAAQRAMQLAPESPCKPGGGECCTSDTPLTRSDADFILDGFKTGRIDSGIGRQAIIRSTDGRRREICPFLNEDKSCTIYEDRPLICVEFGTGVLPETPFAMMKTATARPGTTLNRKELSCMACKSCAKELVRTNPDYPIEQVRELVAVDVFMQSDIAANGFQTMARFVKRELPKVLQNNS